MDKIIKLNNYQLKILHVFTTTSCNLRCIMCTAKDKLDLNPPIVLDPYILKKISDEIKHPLILRFTGGEPLVYFNQNLDLLEELSKNPNIYLSFFTNGTLLTNDILSILSDIDKGFQIYLSIDGYKDIYEEMRVGAKWETIEENLEKIYSLFKNNKNIDIVIKYILCNKTIYCYSEFINFISKNNFGVSMIEGCKLLMDSNNDNKNLIMNKEEYNIYDNILQKIKNKNNLKVFFDSDIIFKDRPGWLNNFLFQKSDEKNCVIPLHSMSIYYDASVAPCCNSTNLVLGNLYHDSIYEIWNNDTMLELRSNLLNNKKLPACLCTNITKKRKSVKDRSYNDESNLSPNTASKRKKYIDDTLTEFKNKHKPLNNIKFLEDSNIYSYDKYSIPIYSELAGMYLYRTKNYQKANQICDIILNIYPHHYDTWLKKSIIFFNLGNKEEAINVIENKVLNQKINHNIAYFWAGYFYEEENELLSLNFYKNYFEKEENTNSWGYQHAKEYIESIDRSG